jgi:hypothetical protein
MPRSNDSASNRGSCDRISLRRASMRRKITLNSPGIWGMSAEGAHSTNCCYFSDRRHSLSLLGHCGRAFTLHQFGSVRPLKSSEPSSFLKIISVTFFPLERTPKPVTRYSPVLGFGVLNAGRKNGSYVLLGQPANIEGLIYRNMYTPHSSCHSCHRRRRQPSYHGNTVALAHSETAYC